MLILTIPSYTNPTVPVRGGCLPPTLAASVRVQALTLAAHSRLPIPNRVNSSLTTRRPPPPYPFEHQCSVLSLPYFFHSSANAVLAADSPPPRLLSFNNSDHASSSMSACCPLLSSAHRSHHRVHSTTGTHLSSRRVVLCSFVCLPLPQVLMLVPPSHVRSSVACIILWVLCNRFQISISSIFYHSKKKS